MLLRGDGDGGAPPGGGGRVGLWHRPPAAFRVRVWQITSGGRRPSGRRPPPQRANGAYALVSGNEVRVMRATNLTGSVTVQGDTLKGNLQGVIDVNVTLSRQK
jgi:hypothetical protein